MREAQRRLTDQIEKDTEQIIPGCFTGRAGCPGRALARLAAGGSAKPGTARRARARGHDAHRPQDAQRVGRYDVVCENDLRECVAKLPGTIERRSQSARPEPPLGKLVARDGIEPPTLRFSVTAPTDRRRLR